MSPYPFRGSPNHNVLVHQQAIRRAVEVLQAAPVGTLERWHARGSLREALGNHHTYTEHFPYDQREAFRADVAWASKIMADAWQDKATDAAYWEHAKAELLANYDKRAAEDREMFIRELNRPSMYEHHLPRC